ncbi:MAG: SDR family NAD(P)-dependent oxidoreductase [Oligoflexia bacterium]|nr:SDR family NAD(P)-dependent oxidoreductase [Oligoflexia bacterium]
MQIKGNLSVISGASRGIGAALAKEMAHQGGRIVILARSLSDLEKVAGEIKSKALSSNLPAPAIYIYAVDLSDAKATEVTAQKIISEIGVPDILINNAGAGKFRCIDETTSDEVVQMMALPYFAAFYLTRAFLPAMLSKKSGHIVNMTSPSSVVPFAGSTGYSAARWAMRGFTEALRGDLRGTGIRVTLAMPGKVDSSYWEANSGSEDRVPSISKLIPTLTEEKTAKIIARGIEWNCREIIAPFMVQVFYVLYRLFPRFVTYLVHSTGWKHPSTR